MDGHVIQLLNLVVKWILDQYMKKKILTYVQAH